MTKTRCYLLACLLIVTLCSISAMAQEVHDSTALIDPAAELTDQELFDKAANLYEERNYDRAAELYVTILSRGQESAPVYYNLGNARFKAGDLGYAVLYYHRALRLAPGDPDILANLEFAKLFTSIQMEGVELNPVTSFLKSIVAPYRLRTMAWISSLFFVSLFLLLIARFGLGLKSSPIRVGTVVALVLLMLVGSLTTFKYNQDYVVERGVLIADDCPVLTGPSATLDVDFDAAPGLVVEILGESGKYYNVLFENKRRGWVEKQLVAVI